MLQFSWPFILCLYTDLGALTYFRYCVFLCMYKMKLERNSGLRWEHLIMYAVSYSHQTCCDFLYIVLQDMKSKASVYCHAMAQNLRNWGRSTKASYQVPTNPSVLFPCSFVSLHFLWSHPECIPWWASAAHLGKQQQSPRGLTIRALWVKHRESCTESSLLMCSFSGVIAGLADLLFQVRLACLKCTREESTQNMLHIQCILVFKGDVPVCCNRHL